MKINVLKAIREYDDIYGETLRIAEEMEHCFKQYEHDARRMDYQDRAVKAQQIEVCWAMHDMQEQDEIKSKVTSEEVKAPVTAKVTTIVVKSKVPVVRNRAYNRKRNARAKHQMRQTARIVSKNYDSRDQVAPNKLRFYKNRDGSKMYNPKNRAIVASNVWARAQKMKLVAGSIGD